MPMFSGDAHDFHDFLRNMIAGGTQEYEPICSLNEELQTEWDEIVKLGKKAESLFIEAKAKKELFWLKAKKNLSPKDADRNTLKIEDGIIYGTIDTPSLEG